MAVCGLLVGGDVGEEVLFNVSLGWMFDVGAWMWTWMCRGSDGKLELELVLESKLGADRTIHLTPLPDQCRCGGIKRVELWRRLGFFGRLA